MGHAGAENGDEGRRGSANDYVDDLARDYDDFAYGLAV